MTSALAWALAATPSPTPASDPTWIGPGLTGFLATFALVVVCLLLFVSMVRRLRRMQYRAERDPQPDHSQPDRSPADDARPDGHEGEQR